MVHSSKAMDKSLPSTHRSPVRRSRSGCSTCRGAKVKCKGPQPLCERCNRLHLSCGWTKLPPLKERRLAHGSFKSSNSSKLRDILPNETSASARWDIYDVDDCPATSSDLHKFGIYQFDFGSSSDFDWSLETYQDSLLPLGQALSTDDLRADGDHFSTLDDSYFSIESPRSARSHAELYHESTSMITSTTNILESPNIVSPPPGLLAQFSTLPASIESSPTVHFALYYYQTTLSLSNTTKDPIWSTSMVFLRLGSKRPLVMHLLLASSLKSIVNNQEANNVSDILAISKHHFQIGAELLIEELRNRVNPDHVSVMTAFWFMFLYRSRQANLDMGEMTQLSQTVGEYVRKHQLDRLCTESYTQSAIRTTVSLSHRKRSLLARLLIWIFYADVSFGFRCRGGSLAKYLSDDFNRTSKVYKTSKAVLQLHWGVEYPVHQVEDDVQNSEVLEMLYKSFMIYHEINELSQGAQAEERRGDDIDRKLSEIEENHSSIFVLAKSAGQERPRLWQNADWVASLFYAIRIYNFRANVAAVHAPRPPIIENALSSLLEIAYRTYTSSSSELYRCPQWPLLIAGAETTDRIHRDWILEKMSPDIYKGALIRIIAAQEEIGGRIEMSRLREMCDVGGLEDEIHRVNVKRIGFGAWC